MPHLSIYALFTIYYGLALVALAILNHREFTRSPEKRTRYKALPVAYKLACLFVVTPLFAATIVAGPFVIPAVISYLFLEAACVRWYRKAGLLPLV
jgi:hypothetical protein